MKKYYCDVCGVELPEWNERSVIGLSPAADICALTELCPRCETLTFKLDVPAVIMAELRRLAAEDERVEPTPSSKNEATEPSAPVRPPMGKAAREKRAILSAIAAYRKEHGPGSIPELARLSKVEESELRGMISCAQVPITTWRQVGKALGVVS